MDCWHRLVKRETEQARLKRDSEQAGAKQHQPGNGHSEEAVRPKFFTHGTPPTLCAPAQTEGLKLGGQKDFERLYSGGVTADMRHRSAAIASAAGISGNLWQRRPIVAPVRIRITAIAGGKDDA
jgi:hypothetical protein